MELEIENENIYMKALQEDFIALQLAHEER